MKVFLYSSCLEGGYFTQNDENMNIFIRMNPLNKLISVMEDLGGGVQDGDQPKVLENICMPLIDVLLFIHNTIPQQQISICQSQII